MAVTPIGNRPVGLDTWTAQSTKEIERLTNAGGVSNHVKAMGEVIKLQGGVIGDTASYSWAAVKAIPSLDMTMLVQSVKLAVKHGIQAGLTLPGLVVPRLVLTTTQFLDIKGQELPKNWQAQAKALATQVRERGSEYAQKGVDLAKKVHANPKAMMAVKVGAGLAALGLGGLAVSRYLGGSTPVPKEIPGYGIKLWGPAALAFLGIAGYAVKKTVLDPIQANRAAAAERAAAALTVAGIYIPDLATASATIVNADGDTIRRYLGDNHGNQFNLITIGGVTGFLENNQFFTGRVENDVFVYQENDVEVRADINPEVVAEADADVADKTEASQEVLRPFVFWVYEQADTVVQNIADAQQQLDDCTALDHQFAQAVANAEAAAGDLLAAQNALDAHNLLREGLEAALAAAGNEPQALVNLRATLVNRQGLRPNLVQVMNNAEPASRALTQAILNLLNHNMRRAALQQAVDDAPMDADALAQLTAHNQQAQALQQIVIVAQAGDPDVVFEEAQNALRAFDEEIANLEQQINQQEQLMQVAIQLAQNAVDQHEQERLRLVGVVDDAQLQVDANPVDDARGELLQHNQEKAQLTQELAALRQANPRAAENKEAARVAFNAIRGNNAEIAA